MSSRGETLKRLQSEAGESLSGAATPVSLNIDAIEFAPEVFQPRTFPSDYHVSKLVAAIKASEGKPLDPIQVWWSGMAWYVIDGHHRLEAYKEYWSGRPKGKIWPVPVRVFEGTLSQAICHSAASNSKDKLPMRQQDKSNVAWRLVCLEDSSLTAIAIARAAGVSRRTVNTMRAELPSIAERLLSSGQAPIDLSWAEASRLAKGDSGGEFDEDAVERLGVEWAGRLNQLFAGLFAQRPDSAAYALLHYSPDLPRRLLETDVFQDALEEYLIDRKREEGVPDTEIFY